MQGTLGRRVLGDRDQFLGAAARLPRTRHGRAATPFTPLRTCRERPGIPVVPAREQTHQVNEIELTFLAAPGGMEVVLEADKRGGFLSAGHDALTRFTVGLHEARDWNAEADGWIRQLVEHRSAHGAHTSYGHEGHYGHHGHEGHDGHRSGPGVGTAVAAGAAGLAVGVVGDMVAAEVVDEIGDFFEGDEGDEGDEG